MTETAYRRVPSLFTTMMVLLFVGVFLFIALLTRRQELAILCLLVLGMAAGMKIWTRFSASSIRCTPLVSSRRLFAGQTLSFAVDAENRKFLPIWIEVSLPVNGPSAASFSAAPLAAEADLFWFQRARFDWDVKPQRRGVYDVGPMKAASGDLYGFYATEQEIGEHVEVIVYPRLVPIGPVPLPRQDFFGLPGGRSPVDDPAYLMGTRDYHHGRPARFIHWKASARHSRLQEKVFQPTQHEKVLLVVDVEQFAESRAEEAFERALEVVASLAVRLDTQGCSFGFLANGRMTQDGPPVVSMTKNPEQLQNVLDALARVTMTMAETVPRLLRSLSSLPWGTSCVYFTFEEHQSTRVVREYLKERRIPMVLITYDLLPVLTGTGAADAGPLEEASVS
jgi:uncharacterized protein (DUF58 family)